MSEDYRNCIYWFEDELELENDYTMVDYCMKTYPYSYCCRDRGCKYFEVEND